MIPREDKGKNKIDMVFHGVGKVVINGLGLVILDHLEGIICSNYMCV